MDTQTKSKLFPVLKAKTLAGRRMTFPDSIQGQKTFIILVFEDSGRYENAQFQANEWALFWEDDLRDLLIDFYEIPMMSGKYVWISAWVDAGMRSGIEKEKHDLVACFYGNKEKYKQILEIEDLSQAHVFLLDEQGQILSRASGQPTVEKISLIRNNL